MKFFLFLFLLAPSAWATNQLELNGVLSHVAAVHEERGLTPVVIADLDETLIDSIPRRFEAYHQAFTEFCGTAESTDCKKALALTLSDFESLENRYDTAPLFDRLELSFDFRRPVQDRMFSIYLSGAYVSLDQPIAGSVDYIRELRNRGATVFFVTARPDREMRDATWKSLEQLGLAEKLHPERLVLRAPGEGSLAFKKRAFGEIRSWAQAHRAEVQVVMENEPENMNAMTSFFPFADAIFVEGAFMKNEHLRGSPLRIVDFL